MFLKICEFSLKILALHCFSPTGYVPPTHFRLNWAPAPSFRAPGPSHQLSRTPQSPVAQSAKPGVPRAPREYPQRTLLPALGVGGRGGSEAAPKTSLRAFPLFVHSTNTRIRLPLSLQKTNSGLGLQEYRLRLVNDTMKPGRTNLGHYLANTFPSGREHCASSSPLILHLIANSDHRCTLRFLPPSRPYAKFLHDASGYPLSKPAGETSGGSRGTPDSRPAVVWIQASNSSRLEVGRESLPRAETQGFSAGFFHSGGRLRLPPSAAELQLPAS